MNILDNDLYKNDVDKISNLDFIDYNKLKNKSIFISGATGMIGSFLVDVLMNKNNQKKLNCKIYALGRNKQNAEKRFNKYKDNPFFNFIEADINNNLRIKEINDIDYVLHLASNTHPKAYSTDPIGTIMTNIIGTQNMLDFAIEHNCKRFAFASTCEIYGENRGDVEKFDEKYCGYIDCNSMRAGYPEGKRCGEALCQAYIKQKNMDIVIPRLTRTFGPTMLMDDTKAISQFLKNGIRKENIVLKSEGKQYYSYTYVADAVSGLLLVLLSGKNGEAYNIADESCDIKLKDLAKMIADCSNAKVVFELPDEIERAGFSKATKARLDNKKIKELNWKCMYSLEDAIYQTLNILKIN